MESSENPADQPSGLRHSFRALKHRSFQIFLVGAVVSGTGTWLSQLVIPFVLYQITGNALWVGYAAVAQFLPYVLCGPWGGALADRMPRKRVLLITQSAMAGMALVLYISWELGLRDPFWIVVIIAGNGIINGLNMPSWQAFLNDLVPRDDLRSAVAINSMQFNVSRAIGPAIGGLLLATVGAGTAFLINALSFIAVIIALLLIQPIARDGGAVTFVRKSILRETWDAARYAFGHPGLRITIVVSMLFSIFANPIYTLTVILSDDVYGVDPLGLGLLNAALGIGAIAIAPLVAGSSRRIRLSQVVQYTLIGCGAGLIVLGLNNVYWAGVALLLLVGAAAVGITSSSQSALQLIVTDRMRGRVISVRFLLFTGLMPVGTQWQTAVAEAFGIQAAIMLAGVGLLLSAIVLLLLPARIGLGRIDDPHDAR